MEEQQIENMKTSLMIVPDHLFEQDVVGQATTGNIQVESTINTKSLLDLNDDCLREIFKFLNASELCSIADTCLTTTCTCLKEIAKDIFKGSHKIWNFDDEAVTSIDKLRRIFFNFGSTISEVQIDLTYFKIDAPYRKENALDVVIEFCSDTLESLKIENCTIPEEQMIALKPLLKNIKKLILNNVTIADVEKDWFGNCEAMIELDLSYSEEIKLICENIFPKLERFTCWTWARAWGNKNFETFFSNHKNLKAITIRSKDRWTTFLPIIADNCRQLIELDIFTDQDEDSDEYKKAVRSVSTLEHLQQLTIDSDYQIITKFIQGLSTSKSLEHLSIISACCDPDFMPAVVQLQQLRKLDLFENFRPSNLNKLGDLSGLTNLRIAQRSSEKIDFDIVQLIKRLINVKLFMFDGDSFQMDKETYFKIVNIVRERSDRSQRKLEIWCRADNDATDLRIFRDNGHIVQIHRFG